MIYQAPFEKTRTRRRHFATLERGRLGETAPLAPEACFPPCLPRSMGGSVDCEGGWFGGAEQNAMLIETPEGD